MKKESKKYVLMTRGSGAVVRQGMTSMSADELFENARERFPNEHFLLYWGVLLKDLVRSRSAGR
jgi:hypothetical protein